MKVFRELLLTGDPKREVELIEVMQSNLPPDWTRAVQVERELNDGARLRMYCFECAAAVGRPAASLWIFPRSEGTGLYVSNIVPREVGELGKDLYNAILEDFYSRVAFQAAGTVGWSATMSGDDKPIESWLGENAAQLLKEFSGAANKATGSSHPLDAIRWRAFLISAHRVQAKLDASRLAEWLAGQGWDEERASELAIEYEQSRDLLSAYDECLETDVRE
jgi:hypothetical protein